MPATATAVSYKELGFVNTREMFKAAMKDGYAVPAYNFNNMEQLQAILTACVRSRSPVILQLSKGARDYANATLLRWMAMGAMEMIKEMKEGPVPVALHLDHGDSFELCKSCIENGFSSVMIDASHLPYEENIKLTTPYDLEKLSLLKNSSRIGLGLDSHKFTNIPKPLILGGVLIPNEQGLEANSDGDVILHSLFNAFSQAINNQVRFIILWSCCSTKSFWSTKQAITLKIGIDLIISLLQTLNF